MEPDLFVPGDQQYQMVNEPLQPMGIAPLIEGQGMPSPDFKKVAGNLIKNRALNYAAGKLGLNAAQASGLMSILGVGANVFAPLAAASALTGRSLGISDYLANKRAQKEMRSKRINDPQGDVTTYPTGIMAMQASKRDEARGSIPAKTSAPAKTYSAPQQTSGTGGLHNYG